MLACDLALLFPLADGANATPLLASEGRILLIGLTVAGVALLIGTVSLWLNRRRSADTTFPQLEPHGVQHPILPALQHEESTTLGPITTAIQRWLDELSEARDIWGTLDLLIRQVLAQQLNARHVRCYHVRSGHDTIEPLTSSPNTTPTESSARAGVLGHVATTGREYLADDPSHGELVDDLAARCREHWAWVWPVIGTDGPIGVIAVGESTGPADTIATHRAAVAQLLTFCWRHVLATEQLQLVRRTDHASGVLTRHEFFTLAESALNDSYAANEPVVVAVLVLEGLRGLDDDGRWRERDGLVEQVGRLIAARVRSDDLVGRFADDRFVVLLRRLDSGLGRLIAEKMLIAINETIGELGELREVVRLRLGLSGSGLRQPAFTELLERAFDAVERARTANVSLECDLPTHGTPGQQS